MANETDPLQKAVMLKYEGRVFFEYLKAIGPYIVQCYGDEITDEGVNDDICSWNIVADEVYVIRSRN